MKKVKVTAILMAVLMLCVCVVPAYAADDDDLEELFGYVEDNLYVNEFFDFAYMLPNDSFSFASEAELELQGRVAKKLIKSDEFDVNDLPETWLEMMASDEETSENVTAAITVVPDDVKAIYDLLPMSTVVEVSLETLKATLETSGMNVDYIEIDNEYEYSFDNYCCVRVKLDYMGIDMYEEMLYLYKDGFQVVLTATGLTEEKPNELLEYLFILDEEENTVEVADTQIEELIEEEDGDSDSTGTLNDLLDSLSGLLGDSSGSN